MAPVVPEPQVGPPSWEVPEGALPFTQGMPCVVTLQLAVAAVTVGLPPASAAAAAAAPCATLGRLLYVWRGVSEGVVAAVVVVAVAAGVADVVPAVVPAVEVKDVAGPAAPGVCAPGLLLMPLPAGLLLAAHGCC